MNTWLKWGIPVVLGLVAGGINWFVLQSELKPHEYVIVRDNIKAGEVFKPSNLEKFTLKGIDGSLEKGAVPYTEAALSSIAGVVCARDLRKGDLVLWRDVLSGRKELTLKLGERGLQIDLDQVKYEPELLQVGSNIGFVIRRGASGRVASEAPTGSRTLTPGRNTIEGPFRIVSVGKRVSAQAESNAEVGGQRILTLAIKTELPADKTQGETIDQASRLLEARWNNAILAIVLYPSNP